MEVTKKPAATKCGVHERPSKEPEHSFASVYALTKQEHEAGTHLATHFQKTRRRRFKHLLEPSPSVGRSSSSE